MQNKEQGFTLIEVMITVAIIAIISIVALPSYKEYVVRANRAAAASYLLEVANMQELNFLDERAYAASMADLGATAPDNVSGNYDVTTVADNTATPPTYSVSADPKGSQASDDACGELTINQKGVKGHASGGVRCWD